MSEQVRRQRPQPSAPVVHEQPQISRSEATNGFDDLLDSIDAALETNAEEYVRSFVQKGGQ